MSFAPKHQGRTIPAETGTPGVLEQFPDFTWGRGPDIVRQGQGTICGFPAGTLPRIDPSVHIDILRSRLSLPKFDEFKLKDLGKIDLEAYQGGKGSGVPGCSTPSQSEIPKVHPITGSPRRW